MVPQHRPVHTASFWWWRLQAGGGYLVPPQQLSNAEVPRGKGHGACDEAAVVTNTRRGRRTGGGGVGVRLFGRRHALRPKCTAPTTAAEGGGGGGGQKLYTQTRALEVGVWPCLSPRLGTRSSLLRHMDGPLDTNSAAAHPLIRNPPPPQRLRRGGGRGRWQKILKQKRRGPSRAVHGT